MKRIEEDVVESTWQEVAGYGMDEACDRMNDLAAQQPALVGFVHHHSKELSRDAQELGMYIFFVVYKIFEKSAPKPIKRISSQSISDSYQINELFISSLENAHEKFFKRNAETMAERQPNIMRYVLEAMMEKNEDDPVELTEEDVGMLFLIEKTVIDVLDSVTD